MSLKWIFGSSAIVLHCLWPRVSTAQWEDVSTDYLLAATASGSQFGCGMSCADFNGDGWDDLTFAQASGTFLMYAGSEAGFILDAELVGEGMGTGVLWVDVDDDGDLDLFTGRRDYGIKLYIRTASGSLLDQSNSRGVPLWSGWRPRGISACDFDRDGDLDVYIASYHIAAQVDHHPNALLINDGNGFFTVADDTVGVDNGVQTSFHGGWLDYDGDGWQDLWVINDRLSFKDALYHNQGDGTFIDVAEEMGLDVAWDPMTATIFDPDRDGDWDLFTTDVGNIAHRLQENTDSGFVEIAAQAGVEGVSDYGWGACVVDVDGDMNEDLMVATLYWPFESNTVDNVLYMGVDSGLFFIQDSAGWPNEQFPLYHIGRCDLDGDAVPDLVCHGAIPIAQVLRNTNASGAHRLAIKLVGTPSNMHAVGAVLKVYAGGIQQMQQVDCGTDYVTQHSFTRFFGLGSNSTVDSVVVQWPLGNTEKWIGLPVDTSIVLIEGTSNAAMLPMERTCPWHDQGWQLPFDPDAVDMTWNGAPVTSDVVWVSESGTDVLEASWWNGHHVMEFVVTSVIQAVPELEVDVVDPACSDDPALVSWGASGAEAVFWADSIQLPLDSALEIFEGPVQLTWNYGGVCGLDTMIEVHWPDPSQGDLTWASPACAGGVGTAEWLISGGVPPWNLDWGGADPEALGPGSWPVVATDSAGCALADSVLISMPDSIVVIPEWSFLGNSDTAQISLNVAGGTPPYAINWSGGLDGNGLLLAPGSVAWLLEDASGCLVLGNLTLGVNDVEPESSGEESVLRCWRMGPNLVFRGPYAMGQYALYDMTGRLLDAGDWNRDLPMNALTSGPVIIRAVTPDGQRWVFLR